ncbi:MAG: hypothetical protein A3J48_00205 [Candidatus Doudnabacteria bacterium RIFCSPHIGHO2_02_FULL_46_11]|uniref:DinB-like domain-containing protein n=1 Tax=Candidatus Doudnabacteria bacterium RIFCSPHIGHO2_02_FULL_46_11 TaxID=1817832 RepID=A0A1F5P6R8_9BACT|nr:MAG: hypothetical protein A3J48_00205 [Candidatus Doudnabacteria bacterium RIFCSPHIGHO2_02_FULL_46_11]
MNAVKIIQRGHQNLIDYLKDLSETVRADGFVTGSWAIKDIINHLGIYEELQIEAFSKVLNPETATPLLNEKTGKTYLEFNDEQEKKDKSKSWQEVLDRYHKAYATLKTLVENTAPELMAKPNTTTWYGDSASLEDVIAYNYGHKKHHLAQIKLFRQQNKI